jgi:Ca2+-binding EF-hand superfamily protein
MLKPARNIWIAAAPLLIATGLTVAAAIAQTTASAPKLQDKLAIGQDEVKQLLLLMDTDKNGKISKQEYMNFMAAEFDRLDKDKSGELDVKELEQSRLRVSHFTAMGK